MFHCPHVALAVSVSTLAAFPRIEELVLHALQRDYIVQKTGPDTVSETVSFDVLQRYLNPVKLWLYTLHTG